MEGEIICLDTSVLIDFFRKKNKEHTFFYRLTQEYSFFAASVITEYEIFAGCTKGQQVFWEEFFEKITVLPFDREVNAVAVTLFKQLKSKSKLIEIPDIFIAATAIKYDTKLATNNRKHFERIDDLQLIAHT